MQKLIFHFKFTLAPDFPVGSSNCDRYFASFAFNKPKWYSVAEKIQLQLFLQESVQGCNFTTNASRSYFITLWTKNMGRSSIKADNSWR